MTKVPDRYGVVGHPVSHSLSPRIHAAFGLATGDPIDYRRIEAPLDGFVATVERFFASGGRGLNVTVPFKGEAFAWCDGRVWPRARDAGAVNVLAAGADGCIGDNTDGIGLVADLSRHTALAAARVLLLGAGGAARGVVGPLVEAGVREVVVVNRDRAKAAAMVARFAGLPVRYVGYDDLGTVDADVIVNATSAGLSSESLPVPSPVFARARCVLDMVYGPKPTRFMDDARRAGAPLVVDGLGMLVEQAAESFCIWRGVRPATAPVLAALRASMAAPVVA